MKKNIDDLLDDVYVHQIGLSVDIEGWYGVSTDDRTIAYFESREDAYMFRLNYVNRILNG